MRPWMQHIWQSSTKQHFTNNFERRAVPLNNYLKVEGVVAERNLSLAHVIGLFTEFFRKCGTISTLVLKNKNFNFSEGIENLRFKPTYNPYTEPSMEVFAFHEGLNKWVEIGNSGMFRPEMLLPMGLPEDVGVVGFGLSLERYQMYHKLITNTFHQAHNDTLWDYKHSRAVRAQNKSRNRAEVDYMSAYKEKLEITNLMNSNSNLLYAPCYCFLVWKIFHNLLLKVCDYVECSLLQK